MMEQLRLRVPTVTLRHRHTGERIVVNTSDWVLGSLPGISLADYERVGETDGDMDAFNAGVAQRELVELLRERRRRDRLHDKEMHKRRKVM